MASTMSSYCNTWFLVTIAITAFTDAIFMEYNQPVLQQSNSVDSSNYFSELPVSGRKVTNLTDEVYKSALRFLRCSATAGNPHGIALLDPLEFNWDQLADRQTIRLNGIIDGTAHKLSQPEINFVTVALPSAYAKIIGNYPRLSISGMYNVTGALAKTLPVFGSGPYSIIMSNVTLILTTALEIPQTASVYMKFFDVEFSPQSIQVSLGELLGGGPLGALIQEFLQDAALQLVARSRLLIQEDLRRTVIAAANRRLTGLYSVKDVLNFFKTFGNVTNAC